MVIARQYQNPLVGCDISAEFIQQFFHLVLRQDHDILLITFGQTVQRFFQLMRVLLDELISNLTDTIVETVCGIQRTLRPFAKVCRKSSGKRKLGATETVNRLPVVPDRK